MEKDLGWPVSLVVAAISFFVSDRAAQIIGPYFLIICASFAGSFISLSGGDRLSAGRAVYYVLARIVVACVLAIPMAEILHSFFASIKIHSSMSLLAFAIGMVSDFKKTRDWFVGIFKAKVESVAQKEGGQK